MINMKNYSKKNYALNNSWESRYKTFRTSIDSIKKTDFSDNFWTDLFVEQINLFKKGLIYS